MDISGRYRKAFGQFGGSIPSPCTILILKDFIGPRSEQASEGAFEVICIGAHVPKPLPFLGFAQGQDQSKGWSQARRPSH